MKDSSEWLKPTNLEVLFIYVFIYWMVNLKEPVHESHLIINWHTALNIVFLIHLNKLTYKK